MARETITMYALAHWLLETSNTYPEYEPQTELYKDMCRIEPLKKDCSSKSKPIKDISMKQRYRELRKVHKYQISEALKSIRSLAENYRMSVALAEYLILQDDYRYCKTETIQRYKNSIADLGITISDMMQKELDFSLYPRLKLFIRSDLKREAKELVEKVEKHTKENVDAVIQLINEKE